MATPQEIKTKNKLGKKLKILMEIHKLTQQALADAVQTKRQTISSYINGATAPDAYMLQSLADYFRVSVDELLDRHKDELDESQSIILRISELTGLSGDAINALIAIRETAADASGFNDPAWYAKCLIDCLNLILENTTEKRIKTYDPVVDESKTPYETLQSGRKISIQPWTMKQNESRIVQNRILEDLYGFVFNHDDDIISFGFDNGFDNGMDILISKDVIYRSYIKDDLYAALESLRMKVKDRCDTNGKH